MSLTELCAAYRAGTLTKPQYIDAMHRSHASLFEYADFLEKTDIARIEISDRQVLMEVRATGIRLLCDRFDKRMAAVEILNFGGYEKAESDMLLRLLQDDQTIFDIGANIGYYSLTFAKLFPHSHIFAFEPIPATYDYLNRNVRINNQRNVITHNFAFSDQIGELTFYFHQEGSGSASAADLMGTGAAEKITCPVRTLDDFVAETGVKIDFIKCDVEGAELFVLKGGVESLKRFRPIAFAEMLRKWAAKFNYHPNQIIALMAGLGYRCFVIAGDKLAEVLAVDEQTQNTNFLFLHRGAHTTQIDELAKIG